VTFHRLAVPVQSNRNLTRIQISALKKYILNSKFTVNGLYALLYRYKEFENDFMPPSLRRTSLITIVFVRSGIRFVIMSVLLIGLMILFII
jgi:hypothetical protein